MKKLTLLTIILSPAIAFSAGPYTVANFTGNNAISAVDASKTFEDFYHSNAALETVAVLPKDLAAALEDELQSTQFERIPAAVQKTKPTIKQATRFPSNVSEGFEYKVKIGKRLTAFWVVKRGEQHELIFANNAGSKASFSLPIEHFYQLNEAAKNVRAPASDTKSCKEGYVQMQFYDPTKKAVTTCLNLKKAAEITRLGAMLSSYIR